MNDIRSQIEKRIKELDTERTQLLQMLALMPGGGSVGSSLDRPKLADLIRDILSKSPPMQLRDVFKACQQSGYAFRGQNPKMSVFSALSRHKDIFKKDKEGWTVKAAAKHSAKSIDT